MILAALAGDTIRYAVASGREADATVLKMTSEAVGPTWTPYSRRVVWRTEYSFTEADGTPRTGVGRLSVPTDVRRGDTVRVRYTPGPDGRSSQVGRYDNDILWGLAGSVAILVLSSAVAVRTFLRRPRMVEFIHP